MEDRFARLETKIDKLQEAVVSLARVEEQLVSVFNRQTTIEAQITTIEEKTDKIAAEVIQARTIERVIWLVMAGMIGAAFRFFGRG